MWTIKDQVDAYILKYKEELFKFSEDSLKNEELINKLRDYFDKASMSGDKVLEKALNHLSSPSYLARKHLKKEKILKHEKRPMLLYLLVAFSLILSVVLISLALVTFWFFPKMEMQFQNKVFDYSFSFQEKHFTASNSGLESTKGTLWLEEEQKKIFIKAESLNLNLSNSNKTDLIYDCNLKTSIPIQAKSIFETKEGAVYLFVDEVGSGLDCTLGVPNGVEVLVEAKNLSLSSLNWSNPLKVKANNGSVILDLNKDFEYHLDLHVTNGSIQGRSNVMLDLSGRLIQIDLANGSIQIN